MGGGRAGTYGGGFFTPDFKAPRFTDAATIAAMEYRAGLQTRLKVTRNVKTGGTVGDFTTGKVAMVTNGSFFVANVKRATTSALNTGKVAWDVAPLPRGPKRAAGLTAELGIGIPAWEEEGGKVWTGEKPAREGAAALQRLFEEYLSKLKREGKV